MVSLLHHSPYCVFLPCNFAVPFHSVGFTKQLAWTNAILVSMMQTDLKARGDCLAPVSVPCEHPWADPVRYDTCGTELSHSTYSSQAILKRCEQGQARSGHLADT